MGVYKVIDIFGNEELKIAHRKNGRKNLFTDYDSFTEKFEVKKTTDDCYTPDKVYKVVLDYVLKNCEISEGIENIQIVRPFYPGGDYQAIEYEKNSIVIDNPPFSLVSKICQHYEAMGVRYFLFAPHLTLFQIRSAKTRVVTAGDIVYENGANVKTSFVSNMIGDYEIISASKLRSELNKLNKPENPLPKYEYPANVLTVTQIDKLTRHGIDLKIKKSECHHIGWLDAQKPHGKSIFGSGYLLSGRASAERASAERASAERASAERASAEPGAAGHVFEWQLSERELSIIKKMNE
jgi:hypothetical protein